MAFSRSVCGLYVLTTVALGSACGSNFDASGGGAAGGDSGNGAAGRPAAGSSSGGDTSAAGAVSAGAGGTPSEGGGPSAGSSGSTASAGASNAGAGGSNAGSGGSAAGAAGSTAAGAGGKGGPSDCLTLRAEYNAAVEKARVCDVGSTDECSATSTLPTMMTCGCPTLVNRKSEYTAIAQKKYQAYQDNHCAKGPICAIACPPPTRVSCAKSLAPGKEYVCSGPALP